MKVGDLVWSLSTSHLDPNKITSRRLAIIREIEPWGSSARYHITIVVTGQQGYTQKKWLEPMETE